MGETKLPPHLLFRENNSITESLEHNTFCVDVAVMQMNFLEHVVFVILVKSSNISWNLNCKKM